MPSLIHSYKRRKNSLSEGREQLSAKKSFSFGGVLLALLAFYKLCRATVKCATNCVCILILHTVGNSSRVTISCVYLSIQRRILVVAKRVDRIQILQVDCTVEFAKLLELNLCKNGRFECQRQNLLQSFAEKYSL